MASIPTQMWPTVERFAATLGLKAAPRTDGSVAFAFEHSGVLTFTPTADGAGVVMTLSRPTALAAADLLAAGGYDESLDVIVHSAMTRSGAGALSIVYTAAAFEVPAVASHADHLSRVLARR